MYSTNKVQVPSKTGEIQTRAGTILLPRLLSVDWWRGSKRSTSACVSRKCLAAQDGWRMSSSSSLFLSWLNDRTDTTQKQPKNNDVYPKKLSSSLLLPQPSPSSFSAFGPVLPPPSPCVHGGIILTRASLSSYFSHSAQRMKSKTTPAIGYV